MYLIQLTALRSLGHFGFVAKTSMIAAHRSRSPRQPPCTAFLSFCCTSSWPIATHAFGRSSSMIDTLTIEIYHEFNDSLKVSHCAVDKVCHLHCYMMPLSNLIMVLSVKPITSIASAACR